ncbi:MAG: TatD family hydrolase [Pseudomonadota bacterium]
MPPELPKPPDLVDSHTHLDFPAFEGEAADLVARAAAAGVTRMVTIATTVGTEPRARALAEAHDGVFYAAGLHPLHADEEPVPDPAALAALAAHPKMVGIGECGLDYHYRQDLAARQEAGLRAQIETARLTGLPLIIHARDADADMARILREEQAAGPFGFVMHCFSSGPALAEAALELGGFLSMSGIATFKNSHALRAIFAAAPLDRILVETDAPYLAPQPKRGKRNEPAYAALTARTGAEVFGLSFEDFAAATTANFERLFAKAAAWRPGALAKPDAAA